MKRGLKFALIFALFAVCGAGAFFQGRIERDRQIAPPAQLYSVVWKQIAAFRQDDYASAYQQASTSFQEKFNVETFSDFARTEYPSLRRAYRVEFGAVQYHGRHVLIPAYIFLPDGDIIPCVYSLVREEDSWKIDGARVLRRWPAGRRLGGLRA